MLTVLVGVLLSVDAQADVTDDVAESKNYALLYDLVIPAKANHHAKPPAYATNNATSLTSSFDRVAYFLELQKKGEQRRFMWVSMRAFTTDPALLGVPHNASGAMFQRPVAEMNVASNQPGIQSVTASKTGNIEMWPSNYGTANTASIPGASGDVYDWGDSPATGAGYGSLQVHDHGSKVTLLAYNAWSNANLGSDLGIGNNSKAATNGKIHTDWTFRRNSAEYTLRRLRIFVRKGPTPGELLMTVTSPQAYQVVQRDEYGRSWVRVAGTLQVIGSQVEARGIAVQGGKDTPWTLIDPHPKASFVGHLQLSQGWYRLQARLREGDKTVVEMNSGEFGVGDVFITAGQSNSANSGKPPQVPKEQRVGAWGTGGWQFASDPQPIATGGGGSPWPPLGDTLVAKLGVPVGFISVGWGGTSVAQWLPGSSKNLYPRLLLALEEVGPYGARGVLWHQGESDASGKTSTEVYAKRLKAVIAAMRNDAGWDIPWHVARVGYLPKAEKSAIAAVVAGQQAVIDADPLVFAGPKTDDLIGPKWRHDTVHFNGPGLQEHGKRWAAGIEVLKVEAPPEKDAGSTTADAGATGGDPDAGVYGEVDAGSNDLDLVSGPGAIASDVGSTVEDTGPACNCPAQQVDDSSCNSAPNSTPSNTALWLLVMASAVLWRRRRAVR